MEQMADLVLFQNLVASLLGGVGGKMVDLGGGGCCRVIWYRWISLTKSGLFNRILFSGLGVIIVCG